VHPNAGTHAPTGRTAPSHAADRAVAQLRADLTAIFDAPLTGHAQWGVLVRSLDSGELLYARDAGKLMMPASNMKIVTTAAAAEVLGWDARFVTTLETTAPVEHGTLRGDLVVRGGGDPTINGRGDRGRAVFGEWAHALRRQGIHAIDGRIVGDDRLFDREWLGTGWAWDDLHNGYAAPVGALQFNENTTDLTISPGAAAGEPAVVILGGGSGLTLWNHTMTTAADVPDTLVVRRHLDRPVLEVSGTVPLPLRAAHDTHAPELSRVRRVAVTHPTRYFVHALKDALLAEGLSVRGDAVALDDLPPTASGPPDHAWRVLARTESPPFREIAAVLLKVSQNLYAESVLKSLGVATSGHGTTAAGRTAVHAVLERWRLDPSALLMADGSGLSRYNYASPALLVGILERMYSEPVHRDVFIAALPVAGRDGTIEGRMRRTYAEGNATAKTGSLSNVRALSGYVRTRNGEMLVFSIVANSFAIPPATITWMADLAVEVLANVSRDR
jgi:serine-type D-Ala-D-Ala carboxypeptidase/endopeptidase (penicillin-binding protein 4)